MSKQLTWADVAHYYAKNDPAPEIYSWIWKSEDDGYWSNAFEPSADSLPGLIDLADITEEDAKAVLEIAGYVPDAGFTCKAWFAWQYWEYDTTMQNIQESVLGKPAAIHYLISRNYNVFGVPTWKGVQS